MPCAVLQHAKVALIFNKVVVIEWLLHETCTNLSHLQRLSKAIVNNLIVTLSPMPVSENQAAWLAGTTTGTLATNCDSGPHSMTYASPGVGTDTG